MNDTRKYPQVGKQDELLGVGHRAIFENNENIGVGTIAYIGTTSFASGQWVGISLDEPTGENSGSVQGKEYFACQPNCGLFIQPDKVRKLTVKNVLTSSTPPELWLKHCMKAWRNMIVFGKRRREVRMQLKEAAENNDVVGLRSFLPQAEWMEVDEGDLDNARRRIEHLEINKSTSCNVTGTKYVSVRQDALDELLFMQSRRSSEFRRSNSTSSLQDHALEDSFTAQRKQSIAPPRASIFRMHENTFKHIPQAMQSDGFMSCLQKPLRRGSALLGRPVLPPLSRPKVMGYSPLSSSDLVNPARLVRKNTNECSSDSPRDVQKLVDERPSDFHTIGQCSDNLTCVPVSWSVAERGLLRNALTLLSHAGLTSLHGQIQCLDGLVEDGSASDYISSTMAMSSWAWTPKRWRASVGGLEGVNPFHKRTDRWPSRVFDSGRESLEGKRIEVTCKWRCSRQSEEDGNKRKMIRANARFLRQKSLKLDDELIENLRECFNRWMEAQLIADAEIAALADEDWIPACVGDGGGVFFSDGPDGPMTPGRPVFLGPLPRVRNLISDDKFPKDVEPRSYLPMRSYGNSVFFAILPQWETACKPPRQPWVEVPPLVLPEAPLASYVARATIMLHVGGAGCGIGCAVWERLASEHGLEVEGDRYRDTGGSLATHFYETSQRRFVPRAVLADARPDGLPLPRFPTSNVIRGNNAFDGDWADAFYAGGKPVVEATMESLRRQLEIADSVNGIVLTFAGYSGAGGGITSKLLKSLRGTHSKLPNWSFCLVPSGLTESQKNPEYKGTSGTYNMLFTVKAILDTSCQIVTFADNDALRSVAGARDGVGLAIGDPSKEDCNKLLGMSVASVMSPLRIGFGVSASEGTHLSMQRKIETNLIPYPRLMFTIPSLAPLMSAESQAKGTNAADRGSCVSNCLQGPRLMSADIEKGKVMCNALFVRDVPHFTALAKLDEWRALPTTQSVRWCPGGKLVSSHRDPIVPSAEVVSILNSTSMGSQFFAPLLENFKTAFAQRSHVDKYVGAGMEDGEFTEAADDVGALVNDYEEVEKDTPAQDAASELLRQISLRQEALLRARSSNASASIK
eukprot:TRINITY_DN49813_c0_g1_i1.p1 TRINITY_DN49813_c0_g1~~TRINITY_DN49813_c0_g1_i1.p1  ORF type:complete len:1084 (+),score=129.39 TRINITY_DN49813_c0_g1_i1:179-3430(+)